jgi:hypothetical protein
MSSIQRRIENAERRMGIRDREEPIPGIVFFMDYCQDTTAPHLPEPVEEWATLRAAQEEAKQKRVPMIFMADPWREYEVRHGLEPGTLTEHEFRGKAPFAELLAAATG